MIKLTSWGPLQLPISIVDDQIGATLNIDNMWPNCYNNLMIIAIKFRAMKILVNSPLSYIVDIINKEKDEKKN